MSFTLHSETQAALGVGDLPSISMKKTKAAVMQRESNEGRGVSKASGKTGKSGRGTASGKGKGSGKGKQRPRQAGTRKSARISANAASKS